LTRAHASSTPSPYSTLFRSDELTLTRALAMQQRGEHALESGRGGDGVGEVLPRRGRRLARATGREHRPAHRLQDQVLAGPVAVRSEEHTSELQSRENLVCRL